MGFWNGLIRWIRGDAKAVSALLSRLANGHEVVRVELERTLIHFDSRLALLRNTVVLAKPQAVGEALHVGSTVRLQWSHGFGRSLRMEVITPHVNLAGGRPAFVCKVPTQFSEASHRKAERYDARRFTNLNLELPGHAGVFRILDLSRSGVRVATPYQRPRQKLPPSKTITHAVLHLGRRMDLELRSVRPRSFDGQAVGFAFALDGRPDGERMLMQALRSLDAAQHGAVGA